MTDITIDQNSLKELVNKFEEKEYELTDVPQEIIEQFGFACLSQTLMFKEPQIPQHDPKIADYIKSHTFDTLDSLKSYISIIKSDINKLYAIFAYESINFEFDTKSKFSEKCDLTIEDILKTKKVTSEGFCHFFLEMVKLIELNNDQITIQKYSTFAKTFEYDPLNVPCEIKPNHSCIYIKINNDEFISDPTWASGQVDINTKEFTRNYNEDLFLIPIYDTICDRYPLNESQKFLPFNFPFEDFFQSIKLSPFEKKVKTETYPFIKITANYGYISQTYSCNSPINHVYFKIYKKESQNLKQINSNDGITSYEVIENKIKNHKDRCRFISYILFQEEGFYEVEMYIDSLKILNYFVDVPKKSEGSIPITLNYFHDSKFIPIYPKDVLTKVVNDVSIIRFAVAIKRSDILWDITKLNDQNRFNIDGEIIDRKFGRFIKLLIPFDDERYEDQLCITFPSNGRYVVSIYLSNDDGSFSNYVKYYFDVTGVNTKNPKPISPVYYMFNGRKFAPNKLYDKNKNEVLLKPNFNCYLVKKKEQNIQIKTSSGNDDIHLEFKQGDRTVSSPIENGKSGDYRRFKWSIDGDFGEYHLIGWINNNQCFDLTYIYHNLIFKENSPNENELLNDLMLKIKNEDPESFQDKKNRAIKLMETEEEEVENEKKESKCCFLI